MAALPILTGALPRLLIYSAVRWSILTAGGHHGIVGDGGAQWMKAGNGIIHDENPTATFQGKRRMAAWTAVLDQPACKK